MTFVLTPGALALDDLDRLLAAGESVSLAPGAVAGIAAAAAAVEAALARHEPVYGVNTGFGKLARARIPDDQLRDLQRRLLLSHAAGVGPPLPDAVVRLVLILKANGLARGYSGVRPVVVQRLLDFANAGMLPVVPERGSVGASGDLAPLAHLCLPLIGEGEVRMNGERMPAAEGLRRAGLAPVVLAAKEGLALINGTQVSAALALVNFLRAERLFRAALAIGALSVDAAMGSDTPFDARLHELRGQPGQIRAAAVYRALLAGSGIRASHRTGDDRVQDPYSLRCQPQVMGAAIDTLRHAAQVLAREANAVSDNPLVFADRGEIVSGGNFHAEPVALAADHLAVAIAEAGAIAERRVALLIDASFSTLPPFLVAEPGLNSGFMIAQVTAAAAASENKSLAHPASVDSLPTSANQEDHVSMAAFAARRLGAMNDNLRTILAIEFLAAAQGVDFHKPLGTSAPLAQVHALLRARVPFLDSDRFFAPDIAAAEAVVEAPALAGFAGPPLWRD
ncbi:MAG: histidine ammonia-lyase [Candidatus Odyssella sp.]|nr:histidine ammonia-lyase [Candidatus Odyssella sp.]